MVTCCVPEQLAPDLLARMRATFASFRLIEGWGVELLELRPGGARLRLASTEKTKNPGDRSVNGGVQAAFADMSCALALCTAFDGAMPFATSDLHIRYLDPARACLESDVSILRLSPRSAVLECRLTEGDTPIAFCTCHFAIHAKRKAVSVQGGPRGRAEDGDHVSIQVMHDLSVPPGPRIECEPSPHSMPPP